MMKERKSFLLHVDSLNILDDLTDEQAGTLFKAIAAFHRGEPFEMDQIIKIAFSPFKNQFVRDANKYEETCRKRAEAGAKGGKASKRGSSEDKQNKQLQTSESKPKQTEANKADSDNKNKSDSKKDSDSKNKNDLIKAIEPPSGASVAKSNVPFSLFEYWCNAMNKNIGSCKFTPKREKAIKARLKEGYSPDQIRLAIDGCKNDPFSMGQNDRGKPFNDIELICRSGEKLESFWPNDNQPQGFSAKTGRNIQTIQGLNLDD